MRNVYGYQVDARHFVIQIGQVAWNGFGKLSDMTEPEREAVVAWMMEQQLKLLIALEAPYESEGDHE